MKVLHVTSVLGGVGGVQRYVSASCSALAARGHDVEILAFGTAPDDDVDRDVPVDWVPIGRRLLGRYPVPADLRALRRRVRDFPGVVHAHQPFAPTTVLAALAAPRAVLTPYLHAPAFHGRSGWRRTVQLRAVCARFRAVAYISESERSLGSELVGGRRRSVVAWPGVDHRGPWPSSAPRRHVAVVGALVPHKRPDLALRAAIDAGFGADCRIVGSGPMEDELRSICRRAGLDDTAVVLGSVDDSVVADVLGSARVILAPSTEESFGIALLEGIAAGAVPVATDLPSHREVLDLTACEPRHVVPVDAGVDELARAIGEAMAGPAVSTGVAPPTWDDAAAVLEQLYEEVGR